MTSTALLVLLGLLLTAGVIQVAAARAARDTAALFADAQDVVRLAAHSPDPELAHAAAHVDVLIDGVFHPTVLEVEARGGSLWAVVGRCADGSLQFDGTGALMCDTIERGVTLRTADPRTAAILHARGIAVEVVR